jgi:hypothetical protein
MLGSVLGGADVDAENIVLCRDEIPGGVRRDSRPQ